MTLKSIVTAALAGVVAVLVAAAPASAAPQWIDGNIAYKTGTSCIGLDQYPGQTQAGTYTGYWGETNASYPKIGDRYFGHIVVTVIGPGCAFGIHLVATEISLPAGTELAINPQSSDPNDKIRCYGSSGSFNGELTGGTWTHPDDPSFTGKYCDPTQVFQGANGIHLGQRLLAQGQSFEIVFPLRSTRKLSGIAEPNQASRSTATVTSPGSTDARPFQWFFVGDRPIEPDCPGAGTTAASNITNTTAHTKNFVCNWYRSGKVSIEIGEGASGPYQASSQQYGIPSSTQAFYVDQDWNNLIPGTTYHWRAKFVDDKGTPNVTSDDQTYYSQPKTFTTTGTRPTNPPTTQPGAGAGGVPAGGDSGAPGGETPGGQTPAGDTAGQQQQQQIEQQQQQQEQQVPRDIVAPGVRATVPKKLRLRDLLKKGLRASAVCSEACGVQAQLQIDRKTAKKLKLGKKTTTIGKGKAMSPGGKVTVAVKLTGKAKKRLKKLRSLKATLVITATDTAGNKSKPVKKKISLKR